MKTVPSMPRHFRIFFSTILAMVGLLWLIGLGCFSGYALTLRSETAPERDLERDLGTSRPSPEAIIVLTGDSRRIETGLDLLAAGAAPRLFITGAHRDFDKKSLERHWKDDTKALPCCVELGHEARDTRGNAAETKDWTEKEAVSSILMVTSDYHILRSYIEFRHLMPNIEINFHPVPAHPSARRGARFWSLLFREYNKTILALMRQKLAPGNGR